MLTSIFRQAIVVPTNEGRKLWVGDGVYTLIAEGDATDGQYALVELSVTPGTGTPLHIHHAEDEMFYILEGEVSFWADGEKTVATPGAFVHIPKGLVHGWRNDHTTQALFLNYVTPAGFEQFFAAIGTPMSEGQLTPPPMEPDFGAKVARLAPLYNMEVVPDTTGLLGRHE